MFSRSRSVSLKDYSEEAVSKPTDTGNWTLVWWIYVLIFAEKLLHCLYPCLCLNCGYHFSFVVCLLIIAGRSAESDNDILSDEDYSAKVASESSLVTNDKSGNW